MRFKQYYTEMAFKHNQIESDTPDGAVLKSSKKTFYIAAVDLEYGNIVEHYTKLQLEDSNDDPSKLFSHNTMVKVNEGKYGIFHVTRGVGKIEADWINEHKETVKNILQQIEFI